MNTDSDIALMEKGELETALRDLKARGAKVNVSGSIDELRQRLQGERDMPTSSVHAAGSSSTATPLSTKGGGLEALFAHLINPEAMHPVTQQCIQLLTPDSAPLSVSPVPSYDPDTAERYNISLAPALTLIKTIVAIKESMVLDSSPAINTVSLQQDVRKQMTSGMAVAPEVAPLFEAFDIATQTPSTLPDQAQSEVQKQYREDLTHAGLPAVEAKHRSEAPLASTPDEYLTRQTAAIRSALSACMTAWLLTFPGSTMPTWPQMFDEQEQNEVTAYVRAWIQDENDQVDLDLQDQPVDKIKQAVENLMDDVAFPVEDAQSESILETVFLSQCNAMYHNMMRGKSGKMKAESTSGDFDSGTASEEKKVKLEETGPE